MKKSFTQQFEEYLRRKKLRLTDQRKLIVNAFSRKKGHVSAEELYRYIQKTTSSIGFATVYRTLNLLADAGLASGKNFRDGFVRFECCREATKHHDHLICTQCGKIIEFTNTHIEKLQETVAKDHGFIIKDHSLEIYGRCHNCAGDK
jgi:Fur family ferric uptake transcriptional regulator